MVSSVFKPKRISENATKSLDSEFVESQKKLAFSYYTSGSYSSAESIYREILLNHPKDPIALHGLGLVALQSGSPEAAIKLIQGALEVSPNSVDGYSNLAIALKTCGLLNQAEVAYRKAILIDPNISQLHSNLGVLLEKLGKHEAALEAFKKSIQLSDQDWTVWLNLGTLYTKQNENIKAIDCFKNAIELEPNDYTILSNLGGALLDSNQPLEAKEQLEKALVLQPDSPEVNYNLAKVYFRLNCIENSVAYFRQVLKAAPNYAEAHHNLGHALLSSGSLKEGWIEYDWRWKSKNFCDPQLQFVENTWAGEDIKDKVILVWGEQGVGDKILFSSIIPALIESSSKCIIEVERRLAALFLRSFPSAEILVETSPRQTGIDNSNFDVHIPIGSLPRWLRSDWDKFNSPTPYLIANSASTKLLRQRYSDSDRFLVGISWASLPPKGISLEDLLPVLQIPNVKFVSLQYGDHSEEIREFEEKYGIGIYNDSDIDPLADLDFFTSQVAAMDAVVTVQNTTLYVSGGLGIETFGILPPGPDWRWLGKNLISPWHDSVRLYHREFLKFDKLSKKLIENISRDLTSHLNRNMEE